MSDENRPILDEVNEADSWFTAVKEAPVWAKLNTDTREVASREGVTLSFTGDMICRGHDGEMWTQSSEKFLRKYNPSGEKDGEGFEKHLPDPEATRVIAAKIDHPFSVTTTSGKLKGMPGDYLLKSASESDEEYPSSVWIVGKGIFAATYRRT